jgi:hypothetical protein
MRYLILALVVLIAAGCHHTPKQSSENKEVVQLPATGNFGNDIIVQNAIPASEIASMFTGQDSLLVTLSGKITASCKHSGCWMDLDLGNNETIHVTFQDEAFTIPLDAAGKNAVAEGMAIRELIPVATLQNYAREEGKSEEEVAAITSPVYAYEFIAKGVLIEE